jgi:hypothetical protein
VLQWLGITSKFTWFDVFMCTKFIFMWVLLDLVAFFHNRQPSRVPMCPDVTDYTSDNFDLTIFENYAIVRTWAQYVLQNGANTMLRKMNDLCLSQANFLTWVFTWLGDKITATTVLFFEISVQKDTSDNFSVALGNFFMHTLQVASSYSLQKCFAAVSHIMLICVILVQSAWQGYCVLYAYNTSKLTGEDRDATYSLVLCNLVFDIFIQLRRASTMEQRSMLGWEDDQYERIQKMNSPALLRAAGVRKRNAATQTDEAIESDEEYASATSSDGDSEDQQSWWFAYFGR